MPVCRGFERAAEGESLIRTRWDPERAAAQVSPPTIDQAGGGLEASGIGRLGRPQGVVDRSVIPNDDPQRLGPVPVELRRDDADRSRALVAPQLVVGGLPPVLARHEAARGSRHAESDPLHPIDLERAGKHEREFPRGGDRRPVQDRQGVDDRQRGRRRIDRRAQAVARDHPARRVVGNLDGRSRPHGRHEQRRQHPPRTYVAHPGLLCLVDWDHYRTRMGPAASCRRPLVDLRPGGEAPYFKITIFLLETKSATRI